MYSQCTPSRYQVLYYHRASSYCLTRESSFSAVNFVTLDFPWSADHSLTPAWVVGHGHGGESGTGMGNICNEGEPGARIERPKLSRQKRTTK